MHFPKAILAAAVAFFASSALAEDVMITYTVSDMAYNQNIPMDVYTPLHHPGQMSTLQNNGRCLLFQDGNSVATNEVMRGSHVFSPPVMVAGMMCHGPSMQ
ncbi:uncharacterized protein KD926_000686 [Aspergillus affinis]|uniref:uncharacterized protein n=1 Tax=Aspergillus affinis TaxID=1070780 RepID=UPI0022FE3199|nr:uncharacterized protein KD926_000686 [Aspergillus affinis]KAI9037249.1 hypothetical protein KD926_000686 [Aspergillus affinis]